MIECKICGVQYEKACSLGTHLWKTHGLKPKDYYDKYMAKPGEGICPECGKPTLFRTIGKGYLEFCSKKCSAKHIASDPERNSHKVDAMRSTMQESYGVSNAAELESVKEKRKETMQDRYGVQYYSQHADFIGKYHQTSLERYGKESYTQTEEYKEKTIATNQARYGADYWSKNRLDISTAYYRAELAKYDCSVISHPDKINMTYRCNKCGNVMADTIFFINCRLRCKGTPCSNCMPKRSFRSVSEQVLEDFVTSLGVQTTHYERGFIGEYGADIVCEHERVIIEYDGIHWHSDEFHHKEYHLTKTEYAESLGFQMIHVFSDEWENHQDIVKSRLCNILHREIPGTSRKIYARKCRIAEISGKVSAEFLDANHIQGSCVDKYRYGLLYNGELVAVMTFGPSRFASGEDEMLRYCSKIYTSVVGGASRLLHAYIKQHAADDIKLVTYADRRWSKRNNYYPSIGFTEVSITEPNYFYVKDNVRYSRQAFQKYKLVNMGMDAGKSEREIMLELGFRRIYDCGAFKYVYGLEAKNG